MATVLWMSGEDEIDVGEAARLGCNDVESAINATFQGFNYGDGLGKWAVLTIILSDRFLPGYKEINRYRKEDRIFESRLRIPHDEFKAADAIGQRKFIVSILLRSLAELRRRRIPNIDCAKLESDVREVAAAKGWI